MPERAIELLEQKIAARPDDPDTRYQMAVLLVEQYGSAPEPALLRTASEHVRKAIELRPEHAPSHALLGYTLDCVDDKADEALAALRPLARSQRGPGRHALRHPPQGATGRRDSHR